MPTPTLNRSPTIAMPTLNRSPTMPMPTLTRLPSINNPATDIHPVTSHNHHHDNKGVSHGDTKSRDINEPAAAAAGASSGGSSSGGGGNGMMNMMMMAPMAAPMLGMGGGDGTPAGVNPATGGSWASVPDLNSANHVAQWICI